MHGADMGRQQIDIRDIARKIKKGLRSAYTLTASEGFPTPRYPTPRGARWWEDEVDAYLDTMTGPDERKEPSALAEGRSKSQQLPPEERKAEAARKRAEREARKRGIGGSSGVSGNPNSTHSLGKPRPDSHGKTSATDEPSAELEKVAA